MPLHDWTDDRGWDSVHPIWLTYLVEWVRPRLPEGYKAFLGGVPALTIGSANGRPDVSVRRWEPAAGEGGVHTAILEQAVPIDLEETYQRAAEMAYLT